MDIVNISFLFKKEMKLRNSNECYKKKKQNNTFKDLGNKQNSKVK